MTKIRKRAAVVFVGVLAAAAVDEAEVHCALFPRRATHQSSGQSSISQETVVLQAEERLSQKQGSSRRESWPLSWVHPGAPPPVRTACAARAA